MYTIIKLKTDLQGILKVTSTDKINNLYEVFNRGARECLIDVDFAETRRIQQIDNAIYDEVYDYTVPTDLKGNKVVDVIKQVDRDGKYTSIGSESFNFDFPDSNFNVRYNSGVKTLRLSASQTAGKVLNTCNSLTDDGTWTATAGATNLTLDELNYISGNGALNFDVNVTTTTGYVENSDFDAVDLSDDEDVGSMFLWLFVPDKTAFTSVDLRWGSSSSAYWNKTATTAQDGAFQTGWNLVRFDWNGATETGSPDSTAVDYLRVTITYDGVADTDFRVDSIMCKTGSIYSLDYYSKYLFSSSAGTWKEEADDDEDYLNLDTDSYNIYLKKVAELCFAQLGNKMDDAMYYKQEYINSVIAYQQMYKSEAKKVKETYYLLFKR